MKSLNKCFTLSALALFAFLLAAGSAFAQPGGTSSGEGSLQIAGDVDYPAATVSASVDVSWDAFQPVSPTVRRADINDALVRTNFFETETQFGQNTWIEIRRDGSGYWVWVCHRVRVCYWPCPNCCIPVWRTTCWRSHQLISDWVSGLDLTMELQSDQDFGNFTVSADGSSFNITVP